MNNFPLSELVIAIYTVSLFILLLYSSHGFIMLFYQHKFRDKTKRRLHTINTSKVVTIQLPLYNEMYVAERLINAVCNIDYPKESLDIQVLDDSTDETKQIVSKIVQQKKDAGFTISHIQRKNRVGFKAGALKAGLEKAKGEYIAIFDADFIPSPDFLKNMLTYFYSNNIGMVQSRWSHINEKHSILTRVQAFALNGHFAIEQKVRNAAGFFINFNGTGGVWRKECIFNSGNWQTDTITEDLDLSYRAQLKGWQFVYLNNFTTPAVLPEEITSLKVQQFRWTKGAVETAKKLLPTIWKSKQPLRIKFQSTFHLTNNFVFPFVLLVSLLNLPILFIKIGGNYNSYFNYSSVFILAFISTFSLYMAAQKNIYTNWISKIFTFPIFLLGTMGLAINNSIAVFEAIINKKSEFVRTPKFVEKDESEIVNKYKLKNKLSVQLFIEFFFTLYSFATLIFSLYYLELMALPFNMMFFFGFFSISMLSIKEILSKK